MNSTVIEAIGYVGSVVVLISMLMTSVVRLRTINTIGSLVFTGYALMIHSYPTAALNFSLALINIYNLVKLYNNKKDYSVVKLRSDDAFVTYFLNLYKADIEKFFPAFVNFKPFLQGFKYASGYFCFFVFIFYFSYHFSSS